MLVARSTPRGGTSVVSRKPDPQDRTSDPHETPQERRVPLTQLPKGATARICGSEGLDPCDQFLLETLGLSKDTCVRVCKASGTCILEVGAENGHPSRIAIAKAIADKVIVGPVRRAAKQGEQGA
jgi:hypothetical protein